ncbi:MAG: DUF4406 domain-containing protein [Daejeonella sp.]
MQKENSELPIIYIAGKISGVPDLNRPKFEAATKDLRSRGHIVRNPLEICEGMDPDQWELCMRKCISVLCQCDLLVLLDDWVQSKGAQIEFRLANDLLIPFCDYKEFLHG